MVVGAKVCELTDGFLWFVCCLYVRILMSHLSKIYLLCSFNNETFLCLHGLH